MTRTYGVMALVCAASCAPPPDNNERATPIPVRTEVVLEGDFEPMLYLLGTVRPSSSVPVIAADGGTIRYPQRFATGLATGAEVVAGELLASFFNPGRELELREARIDQESKAAELSRVRRSLAAGLVAEAEVARYELSSRLAGERLSAAASAMKRLQLRAVSAGVLIVAAVVSPGAEVASGTVLGVIAGAGLPRIESRAAGADADKLQPGLAVRVAGCCGDSGSRGDRGQARGIVREVAPMVDESGSLRVVIDVTDATGLPSPGEGVELWVELGRRVAVVTVPELALMVGSEGESVFILGGSGIRQSSARRVRIISGARGGGRIEIVSGLRAGERVIVAGTTQVDDGVAVIEVGNDAPGS